MNEAVTWLQLRYKYKILLEYIFGKVNLFVGRERVWGSFITKPQATSVRVVTFHLDLKWRHMREETS